MMSDAPFLLDTDLLIEYLRGREAARACVGGLEGRLLVSVVTVAELFAGVRDENEERSLWRFLDAFEVLPLSAELARQAGLWRRAYRLSHGTGLADAMIAATAAAEQATLLTFNSRHFPMLDSVIVPYDR